MRKIIDLSGQTFGKLKAIRIVETPPGKKPGETYWLCECSCKEGRTKVVRGAELRAGRVKSCGCLLSKHPEELLPKAPKVMAKAGDHYGELELIEPVERPEGYKGRYGKCSWWRCRCSCGKEVVKPYAYIRSSPHAQCGHMDAQIRERKRKIGHDGEPYRGIAPYEGRPAKYSGKLRGVRVNIQICPTCKEKFDCYAGKEWTYRRINNGRAGYFCSYSCVRKYDKAHPQQWSRAHD